MPTNDFLAFCATDTGTNLLSQAQYLADAQRPVGNQPGVARSKLVNKAMRQASYMVSVLAQFLANTTGDNILDDENSSNLLTTMAKIWPTGGNPTATVYLSGSGTYTPPAGVRYLEVEMIGGGGGGGGGSGSGGAGGDTTFGSGFLTAGGGFGGTASNSSGTGGAGGTKTLSGGAIDIGSLNGKAGTGAGNVNGSGSQGGFGGTSPFGGQGGSQSNGGGESALVNSGSGGGAVGTSIGQTFNAGGGGGSGAYVRALVTTVLGSYNYAVGASGAGGSGSGGAGGSGMIAIKEYYR